MTVKTDAMFEALCAALGSEYYCANVSGPPFEQDEVVFRAHVLWRPLGSPQAKDVAAFLQTKVCDDGNTATTTWAAQAAEAVREYVLAQKDEA